MRPNTGARHQLSMEVRRMNRDAFRQFESELFAEIEKHQQPPKSRCEFTQRLKRQLATKPKLRLGLSFIWDNGGVGVESSALGALMRGQLNRSKENQSDRTRGRQVAHQLKVLGVPLTTGLYAIDLQRASSDLLQYLNSLWTSETERIAREKLKCPEC